MAGSWYLDKMFKAVALDRKYDFMSRHDIFSWRLPVEYYYAGPNNGRKGQDVVIMYSGGRRVVIEKSAYSKKVLRWARIMEKQKVASQGNGIHLRNFKSRPAPYFGVFYGKLFAVTLSG
jgi:hypothetical protein